MDGRGARGAALAGLLLLAACSGDDSPAPSSSTTTTTSTPDRFARGQPDGVFTIGVLLPRTGPGASLGDPLVDVISAAVQGINTAGGVNGQNVVTRVFDEAAAVSAGDVLDDPAIDAIIGPASSGSLWPSCLPRPTRVSPRARRPRRATR